METAGRLFGRYGYEKTTLDEITGELGIGKATLYNEFPSKEDILAAVMSRFLEGLMRDMDRMAGNARGPALATIRELLLFHVLAFYDHAHRFFHTAEILMNARQLQAKAPIRPLIEAETQLLASLLKRAAEQGEIAPRSDYPSLARLLRKALRMFYPPFIFEQTRKQVEQDAGLLLDILTSGLKEVHS